MKVALAQINPVVGDLSGNKKKIREAHARAAKAGAGLVVFPELALVGYPPLTLLEWRGFVAEAERVLHELSKELSGPPALVGCALPNPQPGGRPVLNAVALLSGGALQSLHAKVRLPTYDFFDETAVFEPAAAVRIAQLPGLRMGVSVCEDLLPAPHRERDWERIDPAAELAGQGLDLLVNVAAQPFVAGRAKEREEQLQALALRLCVPVIFVNQVGGNDGTLFDGRSLAVDRSGKVMARADAFREDLVLCDLDRGSGDIRPTASPGPAEIFRALAMGIADYVGKCGHKRVVLGLSGGIDSAVVAALAADSLGSDRVLGLAMPSGYSLPQSRMDAQKLAKNLGMELQIVPIEGPLGAYKQALEPLLGEVTETLTEENLQARVRGTLIMALANHQGALALATGNKSELATGYCTLYGDLIGGLAPIGDLFKTQVYELARYINREEEVLPLRILERPPTAELRPNQTDQDTLPPYDQLDAILALMLGEGQDEAAIVQRGYPAEVVSRVVGLVLGAEFKRRQAPLALRVSPGGFGALRRIPCACGVKRGGKP